MIRGLSRTEAVRCLPSKQASDLAGAGCSAVAVSYATSERLLRIDNLAAS